MLLDDVNDWSNRLIADNVVLTDELHTKIESLNNRYKRLDSAIRHRLESTERAVADFGPGSQHFLMDSVSEPWERAVAVNRLPYYIKWVLYVKQIWVQFSFFQSWNSQNTMGSSEYGRNNATIKQF